jgi:hypothetical protein
MFGCWRKPVPGAGCRVPGAGCRVVDQSLVLPKEEVLYTGALLACPGP